MACEPGSAVGTPVPTSANVAEPLSATVFAAAVVPSVSVWLALLAVDVNVTEPLLASDAVSPIPAVDSAVLSASIELTLPAATVLLIVTVVAAPVAGVKTKVLPLREFVPALVKSAAVPATARTPAPVGAAVVADAFTE